MLALHFLHVTHNIWTSSRHSHLPRAIFRQWQQTYFWVLRGPSNTSFWRYIIFWVAGLYNVLLCCIPIQIIQIPENISANSPTVGTFSVSRRFAMLRMFNEFYLSSIIAPSLSAFFRSDKRRVIEGGVIPIFCVSLQIPSPCTTR